MNWWDDSVGKAIVAKLNNFPGEREREKRQRVKERRGGRGREVWKVKVKSRRAMRNTVGLKYNLRVGSLLLCGSE